jgi:hypothetical protein
MPTTRQPLTVDSLSIGDTVALLIGRAEVTGEYRGKTYMGRRWRCLLRDDDDVTHFIPETLIDRVVLLRSVEQRSAGEDWPLLAVPKPREPQGDWAFLRRNWVSIVLAIAPWVALVLVLFWR